MKTREPKTIKATELRQQLFSYLDRLKDGEVPLIIERHGKPEAVVLGFEQYKKTLEKKLSNKGAGLGIIDEIRSFHKDYLKAHQGRLIGDSAEIIRQIRDES